MINNKVSTCIGEGGEGRERGGRGGREGKEERRREGRATCTCIRIG